MENENKREQVNKYYRKWRKEHPGKSKEYSRRYYKKNIDEVKKHHRKYYKEHIKEVSEHKRKYHREHAEEMRERGRKYYNKHIEQERKRSNNYREMHLEKIKNNTREWSKKHPERIREHQRKWNKKYPEKLREYAKKRRSILKGTMDSRMSISIRGALKGNKSGRRWETLVGYTVEQLKQHLQKKFTKGMTWARFMAGEIHIDHVVPLSHFHYESPEDLQFKECWALHNLQPLWAKDNMAKSNKTYQLPLSLWEGKK